MVHLLNPVHAFGGRDVDVALLVIEHAVLAVQGIGHLLRELVEDRPPANDRASA
jgi:hypothetical protein